MNAIAFTCLILAFVGILAVTCMAVKGFKAWRHEVAERDTTWRIEQQEKFQKAEKALMDKVLRHVELGLGTKNLSEKINEVYGVFRPTYSNKNVIKQQEESITRLQQSVRELSYELRDLRSAMSPYI